jgi:hypothetical protein
VNPKFAPTPPLPKQNHSPQTVPSQTAYEYDIFVFHGVHTTLYSPLNIPGLRDICVSIARDVHYSFEFETFEEVKVELEGVAAGLVSVLGGKPAVDFRGNHAEVEWWDDDVAATEGLSLRCALFVAVY